MFWLKICLLHRLSSIFFHHSSDSEIWRVFVTFKMWRTKIEGIFVRNSKLHEKFCLHCLTQVTQSLMSETRKKIMLQNASLCEISLAATAFWPAINQKISKNSCVFFSALAIKAPAKYFKATFLKRQIKIKNKAKWLIVDFGIEMILKALQVDNK